MILAARDFGDHKSCYRACKTAAFLLAARAASVRHKECSASWSDTLLRCTLHAVPTLSIYQEHKSIKSMRSLFNSLIYKSRG